MMLYACTYVYLTTLHVFHARNHGHMTSRDLDYVFLVVDWADESKGVVQFQRF